MNEPLTNDALSGLEKSVEGGGEPMARAVHPPDDAGEEGEVVTPSLMLWRRALIVAVVLRRRLGARPGECRTMLVVGRSGAAVRVVRLADGASLGRRLS